MERKTVTSSNLKSIGYDKDKSILEIEFNTGRVYQYDGVPEDIYQDLMDAGSHGGYFHGHIKDKFHTRKIS